MKSHQRGCYFKRRKNVIRKVLISNIIFFILICVLNVNLQHVFAVSLPLVFLFICVYWRHTQFSYKVMLVSSGARSIALFSIYIFSSIALFCAFSVALRHLLTPFGIVNPFLFMEKTKINGKSLIVLHISH